MVRIEPIPIVDIAGAPAERGEQHGRALTDAIGQFYDRLITEAAVAPVPIRERDAVAFALGLLPESRVQAPDLVAEIEGIAEGSGQAFEKVWLLNCFDELAGFHLYEGINAGRACTTVAATGHSTSDGTTYIGQSWDTAEWYESIILRIAASENEPAALIYSPPGMVGGTGMNANGVALVWNSLKPRDVRQGVPIPFLVRRALAAPKLSDAISAVLRPVRSIGFNFILGADFGAVNIEASATRQHLTYIGRHLAHANHYEAPELLEVEGNATYEGSSFVRSGRMAQLLDEAAGHIDLAALERMFRDHANYPGSVCAHLDSLSRPFMTRAAMLYVSAERTMLVAAAPPCEAPFVEYAFAVPAAVA